MPLPTLPFENVKLLLTTPMETNAIIATVIKKVLFFSMPPVVIAIMMVPFFHNLFFSAIPDARLVSPDGCHRPVGKKKYLSRRSPAESVSSFDLTDLFWH